MYSGSLIAHGDWVVEQGDSISGTEIQFEVARLQGCREEQFIGLAAESLKNRTDLAEKVGPSQINCFSLASFSTEFLFSLALGRKRVG